MMLVINNGRHQSKRIMCHHCSTCAHTWIVVSFVICLLIDAQVAHGLRMDVKHCGGQINEVRASGCEDDKQPCRLRRGSSPRLEVDFVSPFQARFVRADVRGRVEGTERLPVYIPWSGMHRNACDGHGLVCPLKRSTKYTYHYEMPITSSTPKFKTEYTWKLTNAWGFTIACFSMPLEIF